MNEVLDKILDEQFQPNFIIDTPARADWALLRLADDKKKLDMNVSILQEHIEVFRKEIERFQKEFQNDSNYLETRLHFYFDGQPHKTTKTLEKLVLPSGTLLLKKATPNYICDDEKLVKWLFGTYNQNLVKTAHTPCWGELKKDIVIVGNTVKQASTGLTVDGVTVEQGEAKFIIKFAEDNNENVQQV